jgi:hypothetical protein
LRSQVLTIEGKLMVARSPLADFTIRVVGCSNPITLETRQRRPDAIPRAFRRGWRGLPCSGIHGQITGSR